MEKYAIGVKMNLENGLITMRGRKLTAKGVQPLGIEQWCFDYFWLYGLYHFCMKMRFVGVNGH